MKFTLGLLLGLTQAVKVKTDQEMPFLIITGKPLIAAQPEHNHHHQRKSMFDMFDGFARDMDRQMNKMRESMEEDFKMSDKPFESKNKNAISKVQSDGVKVREFASDEFSNQDETRKCSGGVCFIKSCKNGDCSEKRLDQKTGRPIELSDQQRRENFYAKDKMLMNNANDFRQRQDAVSERLRQAKAMMQTPNRYNY